MAQDYTAQNIQVLEGLDGSLRVMHDGRIIPSQEAPPRPGALRRLSKGVALTPIQDSQLNGEGTHRRQNSVLVEETHDALHKVNGVQSVALVRRKPNRRQRAWWKAIH